MKRLLLFITIVALSTSAFAQTKGYEGSVFASYRVSFNSPECAFSFESINGYRFNPYIFLGAGLSIDIATYGNICRVGDPQTYNEVKNMVVPIIPLYAVVKVNITKTRISPFFMFKLGLTGGFGDQATRAKVKSQFWEQALGCDFYLGEQKKHAITAILGLNLRKNYNILTWDLRQPDYISSVRFGVGYTF